jgi:hypothetical protein
VALPVCFTCCRVHTAKSRSLRMLSLDKLHRDRGLARDQQGAASLSPLCFGMPAAFRPEYCIHPRDRKYAPPLPS